MQPNVPKIVVVKCNFEKVDIEVRQSRLLDSTKVPYRNKGRMFPIHRSSVGRSSLDGQQNYLTWMGWVGCEEQYGKLTKKRTEKFSPIAES